MNWIVFALVGSVAQLIDGSLGMGFGLTSSTLLVTVGATAAVASAAVHIAEIGTTLASGLSHWHAENVDRKVMIRLAIPGSIGAFLGANFLSNIDLSAAKVYISTLLLMLGFVLLYRNIFKSQNVNLVEINSPKFLSFLGFSGGFIDASGGGGWGPVVTPTIISTTSTEPRKVIGTVSASEFCVALAASLGFLINFNKIELEWATVGGLALGG
ncbi:MAG: sulfite exporter TauE/SafE family protein, partial [Candidatus Nanopelagicaceae bacterium]